MLKSLGSFVLLLTIANPSFGEENLVSLTYQNKQIKLFMLVGRVQSHTPEIYDFQFEYEPSDLAVAFGRRPIILTKEDVTFGYRDPVESKMVYFADVPWFEKLPREIHIFPKALEDLRKPSSLLEISLHLSTYLHFLLQLYIFFLGSSILFSILPCKYDHEASK